MKLKHLLWVRSGPFENDFNRRDYLLEVLMPLVVFSARLSHQIHVAIDQILRSLEYTQGLYSDAHGF